MSRTAVFGYGSLVDLESASATLGREVTDAHEAVLEGWRRRWSVIRHNPTVEKTFARTSDGWVPEWILVVNVELDPDTPNPVNGALIEVSNAELIRLDDREFRYSPIDVTDAVRPVGPGDLPPYERVITYVGKQEHLAPYPLPPETVIMSTYRDAIERGLSRFGPEALDRYRASTGPLPVDVMEGELIRDQIREGNPRAW